MSIGSAQAQWKDWDYDFDQEKKPWTEIQAQIPPPPKSENLLPFEAGGASAHRFFIDAASLSLGEDGVIRYTLVVRTAGGATNTSFEGIRCEMREVKLYALGRPDGTWGRARDPRWHRIEYRELNRHHGVLYRDYFCVGKGTPRAIRDILQDLRNTRRPPPDV